MLIFSREKKTKLSYMIIIFYDNIASFKKSKLTYKLILSKQKQDSISNPVLVSAEIYSQWFIELTLTSCGVELGLTGLTSTSRSIRTTCSKSLALLRSSVSVLSVRPRILVFSAQPSLVQFPTLSSLMGSMLASCPFLRIVFLGFHCP